MGDFNAFKLSVEKIGYEGICTEPCEDLAACCVEAGLEDIRATGYFYTWSNNQDCSSWMKIKLDRVMEGLKVCSPFRFLNFWASHPDFIHDIRVFTPAFVNKKAKRLRSDFSLMPGPARETRSGDLVGVQAQVDLGLPFPLLEARRCFLCFSGGPLGIFSSFGTRSEFY
ncbi:hypothetical protein Dimus_038668 [Dionaea muscipula]